eukprot:gene8833-90_t
MSGHTLFINVLTEIWHPNANITLSGVLMVEEGSRLNLTRYCRHGAWPRPTAQQETLQTVLPPPGLAQVPPPPGLGAGAATPWFGAGAATPWFGAGAATPWFGAGASTPWFGAGFLTDLALRIPAPLDDSLGKLDRDVVAMAFASKSTLGQLPVAQSKRCAAIISRSAPRTHAVRVRAEAVESKGVEVNRRFVLGTSVALAGAVAASEVITAAPASAQVLSADWELVNLPLEPGIVLRDLAFVETDPNHGFLLGSRQTLLETKDGGKTWEPRSIEAAKDEGFNYRFNSISFSGEEGWIVGKPAILLHTTDGGTNWERIPLSAKLPGIPIVITALEGEGQAEMTTDQGAIYATENAAYTWQAAVQETVDATLNRTVSSGISGASYYEGSFSNIARNQDGEYVAVSSRGNFYMTWAPGQSYWLPHNRPVARRIQNMGWTPSNQIWLTTRGGDVLTSPEVGLSEKFEDVDLNSRGFGILDIGYKNEKIGFACGGSGSLFKTVDGGKSWKRDKSGDEIPANLYDIKFYKNGNGFILGNDNILLRYIGTD